MTQFSIVIPVFNEEHCLNALWDHLGAVLRQNGLESEIILADDHSTDRTWEIIQSLNHLDARIKGIRLAQHGGHQLAVFAGLQVSSGNTVITMDGDLQHPPEKIPDLIRAWQNGSDLVYGFKTHQEGRGWFKKFLNHLFHQLLSLRIGIALHPDTSDFQIMDRSLVEKIKVSWRPSIFLRAWIHYRAQSRHGIPFQAERRYHGRTRHNFLSLLGLGLRSLIFFPSVQSDSPPPDQSAHWTRYYQIEAATGFDHKLCSNDALL